MTHPPRAASGARLVIPSASLIPSTWMAAQPPEGFYVFNPAIIQLRKRLLMAYRVDFGRSLPARQRTACALCLLDANLQVETGSVVALSDTITDGGANHYDPRFLTVGDRLFVHYNNNWDTNPNQIFLVELDPDTLEARRPARPLIFDGQRQPVEKNWMLFAHEGELFAIYRIEPHIVLRLDIDAPGAVHCRPAYRVAWDATRYGARYGELRGGAPPVRVGDRYVAIFHSRTAPRGRMNTSAPATIATVNRTGWFRAVKRWLRERLDPLRYFGGVYEFAATPPFAPTYLRPEPLLHPDAEERPHRPTAAHLTPRRVVYPSGLVRLADGAWLVSYGVHDERAVLRVFACHEIEGGAETSPSGGAS